MRTIEEWQKWKANDKYQESLNEIKEGGTFEDLESAFDNLQELINWYQAFELIAPDYTKKMIEIYINKKG